MLIGGTRCVDACGSSRGNHRTSSYRSRLEFPCVAKSPSDSCARKISRRDRGVAIKKPGILGIVRIQHSAFSTENQCPTPRCVQKPPWISRAPEMLLPRRPLCVPTPNKCCQCGHMKRVPPHATPESEERDWTSITKHGSSRTQSPLPDRAILVSGHSKIGRTRG